MLTPHRSHGAGRTARGGDPVLLFGQHHPWSRALRLHLLGEFRDTAHWQVRAFNGFVAYAPQTRPRNAPRRLFHPWFNATESLIKPSPNPNPNPNLNPNPNPQNSTRTLSQPYPNPQPIKALQRELPAQRCARWHIGLPCRRRRPGRGRRRRPASAPYEYTRHVANGMPFHDMRLQTRPLETV